jgi:hypothetical protein
LGECVSLIAPNGLTRVMVHLYTQIIASVRGDQGVAQARLSEVEWKSLASVGRVEDLG